ncbi:MAG TPA: DUF2299 family protein [Steroidobacteraceae bacterium]|jgi:hypothetical protein|nr:DUF2299 family protein [Steroidobacteraceae bacterium]
MLTKADLADPTIIEGWVRDLALTPLRRDDSNNNWRIQFQTGGANAFTISCVNPKTLPRAIMLICGIVPAPENVAAFNALTPAQKREFWERLRDTLNRESIEFQIEGTPVDECPKTIRITVVRFDDGLSLDSFAHTLAVICKAGLDTATHFNERLK